MVNNQGIDRSLRILFLGSGTSTGVPMIGCECDTCRSDDPKDSRLRSSILFSWYDGVEKRNILVDTATDLREQSLANSLCQIDAVLFTHPHADHIHGIDELRSFNFIQKSIIPCYGSEYTLSRIRKMFDYIFDDSKSGSVKPKLELTPIENSFELFGKTVITLPAWHGSMEVFGYRIGDVAYLTDCNRIPEETLAKLKGLKVLIIGAIRIESHATHMTIEEALEIAETVSAEKTYLTHLNHNVKHADLSAKLPTNNFLAYDRLELSV